MKNHRVSPHGNSHGVISVCQTPRTQKEPFGVGEHPHAKDGEEVDKVTQISKEVMVTDLAVSIVSLGHKVDKLAGEPEVKVGRERSEQVATDEYVEHTSNKRNLFYSSDSDGIVPADSKSFDRALHPLSVFLQLLFRRRHSLSEFTHDSLASLLAG